MYGIYLEKDEILQIAICVLAISFAFALVFAKPAGVAGHPLEFAVFIIPLLVTVGSGFILHEMSHKLVAIYYGAAARFRMWVQGLALMLVFPLMGVPILFAAPGAVYIYSNRITPRQNGIISVAGPAMNVALAAFFVLLAFFAPIRQFYSFLSGSGMDFADYGIVDGVLNVWRFGAAMNIMLALFNMIPAFPLDGSKVFAWNKLAWVAAIVPALAFGMAYCPSVVFGWFIMLLLFMALFSVLRLFSR
jgi:Zn-dependent protease